MYADQIRSYSLTSSSIYVFTLAKYMFSSLKECVTYDVGLNVVLSYEELQNKDYTYNELLPLFIPILSLCLKLRDASIKAVSK